jgi:hypothetical protein
MTSESSALPFRVISVSIAVSIAVINSFLLVSILTSAPLTKPRITKSIVPVLVLAPEPNSASSLFSSDVCTITAGYCCSDNSSNINGCLVAFLIVGLLYC